MMKFKTLVFILIALVGLWPISRFVVDNFKKGYDAAEREKSQPRPVMAQTFVCPGPVPPAPLPKLEPPPSQFEKNRVESSERGDHWVSATPEQKGSARNGTSKGLIQQGKFELNATIGSMQGALYVTQPSAKHSGGKVTIEISVESGTVRAYLRGEKDGFVFVEVEPGKPGMVSGSLDDWSDAGTPHQDFVLESRNGEAHGVTYRIYRK